MAADTIAHGTTIAEDNVVSFLPDSVNQKQKKQLKRWKPFVKVSYDSGSDADVESDEDHAENNANANANGASSPTKRSKKVSSRRRLKKETKKLPHSNPANDQSDGSMDSDNGQSYAEPELAESEDDRPRVPGAGWADVMAKILEKDAPEDAPSAVLAKSKDYEKAKKQEQEEYAERRKVKSTRDEWEHLGRVKPKVTDKDTEKKMQRIATRGVVQLFNAVKKQQKRFEDKLETTKSERKRIEIESSVKKGDFLDLLKGTPVITEKKNNKKQRGDEKPESKKPAWSVLKDDFMMGATLKDWDKQSDSGSDALGGGEGSNDENDFSDSE